MAAFDRLYHHQHIGYIIRFKDPFYIQLAYSIIKINFFTDEFQRFHHYLLSLMEKHARLNQEETLKTVCIRTPDPAMEIILSVRELKELYEMVEAADNEMRVLDMIDSFNNVN
jgi:hypothetical protein